MFVPLLILMVGGLALTPQWTAHLYSEIEQYERTLIALDNAAISLGHRDREWMRLAERMRLKLEGLEKVHHLVHFCGRVPTPAVLKCRAADAAAESSLKAFVETAKITLNALWVRSTFALRSDVPKASIERSKEQPFEFRPCPICRLHTQLEVFPERLRTQLKLAAYEDAKVGIEYLRVSGMWNYRLFFPE